MDLDLLATSGVFSAARAREAGLTAADVRRLLADRRITRLHRGWYAARHVDGDLDRHRLRVETLLQEYADTAVATGVSALVRLGLPTYRRALRRVHLTLLDPAMYRHRKPDLLVAGADRDAGLSPTRLGTVHPALALAETGLTGAREFLVPLDAALARRLVDREELGRAVDVRSGRRGVAGMRAAPDWCDGRHESPGETLASYVLRTARRVRRPAEVRPGAGPVGRETPGGPHTVGGLGGRAAHPGRPA